MRTLDSVIREFLLENGKDTEHDYPRFLQFAIAGLKDLHYDVNGSPKIMEASLGSNGTVLYPNDMVNLVRVYVNGRNGEIEEIFENRNQARTVRPPQVNTTSVGATKNSYINHFRDHEPIGREYGAHGGSSYTYRRNDREHRLEFPSGINGVVYIEYLGNPDVVNGQHQVHEFLVEAIKDYLSWKDIDRRKYMSRNDAEYWRERYYTSKHNAKVRFQTRSIAEMINSSRRGTSSSVKY